MHNDWMIPLYSTIRSITRDHWLIAWSVVLYIICSNSFVCFVIKTHIISSGNNGLLFQKKNKQDGLRTYFFKNSPGFFHFLKFLPGNPDKINLHCWKFLKIVLYLLEIPRPKTKTPGNSVSFFLGHPCWKFHLIFN